MGQIYSQAEKYFGKKIKKIEFQGNKNTSKSDLFDIIQMKVGMILTAEIVNNDIKNIFSKGSFSSASIEGAEYEGGAAVTFILEELPIVEEIEFKGMEELTEQEIIETLPLKKDEVFTEKKVLDSVQILIRQYREKGYFNAAIKIKKAEPDPKKNIVKVVFIIDEGEEIKIDKITISGAKVFEPDDIKGAMELEEEGWISDGTFTKEKLDTDRKNILTFYRQNGYLDVLVEDAKWEILWKNPQEKNERVIHIQINIKEGEQSFFNGYDIEWNSDFVNRETNKPVYNKEKLYYYMEFTNSDIGDVFDDEKYNRDKGIINFEYSQLGYIYARVQAFQEAIILTEEKLKEAENLPLQKKYKENNIDYYNIERLRALLREEPQKKGKKFIHTRFNISEGSKGYVEEILVKGNTKTMDKVIRRELLIKEGELFNVAKVQRSREEIYNLGFFKEVGIDYRPGSKEGNMNLIFEVQEQPTGMISLGGGYGTMTGFSINADISENNLNGTGQRISGKIIFGPKQTSLGASWTEPWLFDKPWSLTLGTNYMRTLVPAASLDISGKLVEEPYYEEDAFEIGAGLGHEMFANWIHYHRIGTVFSMASNPSGLVDDSIYLLISQGWQRKNTLTNGISYDNRDNVFNSTKGLKANVSMDIVGKYLGGHDHYNRYEASTQYYWWPFDFTFFNLIRKSILRRWRFVFEHRFSGAFTQQTQPVYSEQKKYENLFVESKDKLFIGGYESLRGWDYRDPVHPETWSGGGSHRLLFGSEFRIPIEPSLVWFVLFFDAGALFQNMDEYVIDETTSDSRIENLKISQINKKTLSMSYFRYSWGMGIRLQIPIMPIRLYWARKLIWNSEAGWFRNHPEDKEFHFVFGIGDKRF